MTENSDYKLPPLQTGLSLLDRKFQIPLNTLFTQVFGIVSANIRHYDIPPKQDKPSDTSYQIGPVEDRSSSDSLTSQLGTPVDYWMMFENGKYNFREKGEIVKVARPDLYLPFASVASFSRAHRDTETYMSGQNGSVIEEYGFEPWDIRIQGFIIKNDQAKVAGNSSVEDQVKALEKFEILSDAINVRGRVFEWLDIHKIAFKNISYPEARNLNMDIIKPYEIRARSVEPIQLIFD